MFSLKLRGNMRTTLSHEFDARSNTFFKRQPILGLFLIYFVFSQNSTITHKNLAASENQTQIVRAEIQSADHQTTASQNILDKFQNTFFRPSWSFGHPLGKAELRSTQTSFSSSSSIFFLSPKGFQVALDLWDHFPTPSLLPPCSLSAVAAQGPIQFNFKTHTLRLIALQHLQLVKYISVTSLIELLTCNLYLSRLEKFCLIGPGTGGLQPGGESKANLIQNWDEEENIFLPTFII